MLLVDLVELLLYIDEDVCVAVLILDKVEHDVPLGVFVCTFVRV